MNFLVKKITVAGIGAFVLIIALALYDQWGKMFTLLSIWLAAVAAACLDKGKTRDFSSLHQSIMLLAMMLSYIDFSDNPLWLTAIYAVWFVVTSIYIMYDKLLRNVLANIIVAVFLLLAGSIATDYLKQQPTDMWFLSRINIWGMGAIVVLLLEKRTSAEGENEKEHNQV